MDMDARDAAVAQTEHVAKAPRGRAAAGPGTAVTQGAAAHALDDDHVAIGDTQHGVLVVRDLGDALEEPGAELEDGLLARGGTELREVDLDVVCEQIQQVAASRIETAKVLSRDLDRCFFRTRMGHDIVPW